jgi:hypothetical protein
MPEIDPDLDPIIVTEGDARSSYKAEPQPPRYTILLRVKQACGVSAGAALHAPKPTLSRNLRGWESRKSGRTLTENEAVTTPPRTGWRPLLARRQPGYHQSLVKAFALGEERRGR